MAFHLVKRGRLSLALGVLMCLAACTAERTVTADRSDPAPIRIPGLKQKVEVLRDRWGVPHIYAQNADDLFMANGYINARDRLFQMDTWRRRGTGKFAEVLGGSYVARDRMARLFRYRGDWNAEWSSYSPDAYKILRAFTAGINAYIKLLNGRRPPEFERAGYDPGLWAPEDCVARIAGMEVTRNAAHEVQRAHDIAQFGVQRLMEAQPIDPMVPIIPAPGLNLSDISVDVLRDYMMMIAASPFQGSNNWAVDGTKSATGKPLLANDPHRNLETPSLRKTVHLAAPGWNMIGSGEPALPGIAVGHNEDIAFGFTITGTDQEDLYVEKLNPKNHNEYWYKGAWKSMEVVKETIAVKGSGPREVELRYTIHGPVIYDDTGKNQAVALKTVALEPGGAGYLSMLSTSRATNWNEFRASLARFKVPSENLAYADRAGNIGLAVAGLAPIRSNWTGLIPVPGNGDYEWNGFVPNEEMPAFYNPPKHFVASANNKVIPLGYKRILTYEWGAPYRAERVEEMLSPGKKFSASDFQQMQYDVVSLPARRFQNILRRWRAPVGRPSEAVQRILTWDAKLSGDSVPAMLFEIWMGKLPAALFGSEFARRVDPEAVLRKLESSADLSVLGPTLLSTVSDLDRYLGMDMRNWQWGRLTAMMFQHPLKVPEWSRGPVSRGGDPNTLNASGGGGAIVPSGASYRQVIDLADWDRSTMTNVPGESGDPASPHYSDLIQDWANGQYHPMAFTRKAVEAVTTERITLVP